MPRGHQTRGNRFAVGEESTTCWLRRATPWVDPEFEGGTLAAPRSEAGVLSRRCAVVAGKSEG